MHNLNYKHYFHGVALFILATIAGLWSWNTLSELFNLPAAQYQHVLAVVLLLLVLKSGLFANRHATCRVSGGRNHEYSNH
ncbi:MAG TPA: hypothetical protein VMZ32_13275 [Gammaproteobacteria bacterium]|nr:hypothetical protein [Gammaproteobacteria bacterium]